MRRFLRRFLRPSGVAPVAIAPRSRDNHRRWRRGWELNPRIEVLQTSPLGLLGTAPLECQYNGTAALLSVYYCPLTNPPSLVHNRIRSMSPIHGYRAPVETAPVESGSSSYGHCLYWGPRGQRCDRPALEDGFCARHAAQAIAIGPWAWIRRLAALLVAAAILWPIVEALLEQLPHWRH